MRKSSPEDECLQLLGLGKAIRLLAWHQYGHTSAKKRCVPRHTCCPLLLPEASEALPCCPSELTYSCSQVYFKPQREEGCLSSNLSLSKITLKDHCLWFLVSK